MIIGIGSGTKRAREEDAGALLVDCHARIRRFTALAGRLTDEQASDPERAEAAIAVHRYFTVALPLHVDDEEESVVPRLRASAAAELSFALAEMARQHRALEAILDELVPMWAAIGSAPGSWRGEAATLSSGANALHLGFEDHLALEEKVIFPALASLPPEPRAAIVGEMRARRRPGAVPFPRR